MTGHLGAGAARGEQPSGAPALAAGTGPHAATPARMRWLGLAGSILLAGSGYLAGARPEAAPATQLEALWGTGPWFRVGLLAWAAGLVLLGWAWWRLGGLLRPGRSGQSLRWVLVTAGWWALPLLLAPPLGSRDLYAYACQGAVWRDGYDPYLVGAAGAGCPWLETVPVLWHDTPAPYGPLAMLASAGAVLLARTVATGDTAQLVVAVGALRLVAVAGGMLVAAAGPRLARACRVPPATAAWLGLVTPLVLVHVVSGGHYDALVAGLVVVALAAAVRGRPVPALGAGAAVGLAVAVKVTAAAALPFVALLAARPPAPGVPGGGRAWARAAAVAGGAVPGGAVAAFAGLTLATGLGTGWAGALTGSGGLGQWSSVPTAFGMVVGYAVGALGNPAAYSSVVTAAQVLGAAVLVLVSCLLLVRAWRQRADPRAVVAAGGAVLAAVVLLGPVVYPWYAVVPLAVLAASVRHRGRQAALAAATLVLAALMLPSGLGIPVLTKVPGATLVVLLTVAVGWWWLRRWQAGRDTLAADRVG